jgi:hypothetical protein
MLDSARKSLAVPQVPVQALLTAGTVGSFLWLLAHDAIQPLLLYALQLYLTF